MLQRIQISVGLLLCFVVTGTQWDLLQTFAWGRMIANYSHEMPLSQAVAKTFDGAMCSLCRVVAKARTQEPARSNLPETKIGAKTLFFFQAVPPVIVGEPDRVAWFPSEAQAPTELHWAPPVPPPRPALA